MNGDAMDDEEFVRALRARVGAAAPRIEVATALVVPRARRRRAVTRALGALAVVAVVAGTAAGAAALFPGRTASPPADDPTHQPTRPGLVVTSAEERLGLIDMWRVDAPGEGPATWLRLSGTEAILFRECGQVDWSWAVGPTTFVASISSWSQPCSEGSGPPGVPWLDRTSLYRADGDGWLLLDESGAVLATLRHDGLPTPDQNRLPEAFQPPVVDDAQRYWVADPAAVPAGLTAATGDVLEGRWVSPGSPVATDPYVELAADGTWTGSDGCNASAGRWATDLDGRLLVTSGAHTEIGCDGAPLPDLLATARRAALDGSTLVLLDQDGAEVVRLAREGQAVTPPAPEPGATPTVGGESDVVRLTCADDGLSVSGGSVVATPVGVRFLVRSTTGDPGTALEYAWSDGELQGGTPLTGTETELVLAAPPGDLELGCTGQTFPVVTLTVVDPNGYWAPSSPMAMGCQPGGVLDMAVPPEAVGRATAREAVQGLADGLGLSGTVSVAPVPRGYVEADTTTWLVYRGGVPYLGADVEVTDGLYSTSGAVLCAGGSGAG